MRLELDSQPPLVETNPPEVREEVAPSEQDDWNVRIEGSRDPETRAEGLNLYVESAVKDCLSDAATCRPNPTMLAVVGEVDPEFVRD